AELAGAAPRRAGRAHGPGPHRRPVAQRGAGRHGAAGARLLRAAVRRHPRELSVPRLEARPVRLRLRAPLRTAWGELREREIVAVTLAWSRSDFGIGEAAPLEPYDG